MNMVQVEPRIRDLGLAERIPQRLAETDFDAVIGISVESAQYLSGYWFPYARNRLNRQNIVIWPKAGEPVLVVGVDQLPGPTRYSWIRNIRPYAERGRRPPGVIVEQLAEALKDMGLARGRIGIEYLYTPVAFFTELKALVPEAEIVDVGFLFDEWRAVKTPQELELITRGAEASEQGLMAGLRQAEQGWTEKQLGEAIRTEIMARGVDDVTTILLGAGDGARGYLTPTDDVMPQGSIVRIDLNSISGGYYADMGRMAVMGEPSAEQADCYRLQIELNDSVLAKMRPGVPASAIFEHCQAEAERLGVELLDQPFIGLGHATGINNSDFPKLNANDQTPLAEGMVLNIEPDIYGPEREIFHVEQMLLVGAEETTVITSTEDWSELIRIGA